MKVCAECRIEKETPEGFRKNASQEDGFDYWCKACRSVWEKKWRKENPRSAKETNRRNYVKHREARILAAKEYYAGHKSSVREAQNIYAREREATDVNYRLRRRLRTQIRNFILRLGCVEKRESVINLLGCPIGSFRLHISNRFVDGMSWENWGEVWEIGHRKPAASFDLRDPAQQKECWHFSNLFPHFKEQNRSDGAKYEGIDFRGLRPADYDLRRITLAQAKDIILEHHYSHSAPSAATLCFGLFSKEALIGAAVFRPAAWGVSKNLRPENPQSVLGLSRFVLVPNTPYNTASYFLSGCIRQIKQNPAFGILVTFADTWQGHNGCIYKASNWKFEGVTPPQEVWTLNGKLIGKRKGKTSETSKMLLDAGAIFHGKFSKLKFTYSIR